MKSIVALPNDYVVVDIETTGPKTNRDDIIEIAAVRFRNGIEVARYQQLVSINGQIDSFVSKLTGITNEMLVGQPTLDSVIQEFSDFIGSDILIGHNIAAFDSCFINRAYMQYWGKELENTCVDTLRLAKKILPDCPRHSLQFLACHYDVSYSGAHRGGNDCIITHECYQKMRAEVLEKMSEDEFCAQFAKKTSSQKLKDISPTSTEFNSSHPLYQKAIVFTGALSMTRSEAAQMAADVGAVLKSSVTTKTAYLVVGGQDIDRVGEDGLSSKEEKAFKLNESGKAQIKIISEKEFVELVNGNI